MKLVQGLQLLFCSLTLGGLDDVSGYSNIAIQMDNSVLKLTNRDVTVDQARREHLRTWAWELLKVYTAVRLTMANITSSFRFPACTSSQSLIRRWFSKIRKHSNFGKLCRKPQGMYQMCSFFFTTTNFLSCERPQSHSHSQSTRTGLPATQPTMFRLEEYCQFITKVIFSL